MEIRHVLTLRDVRKSFKRDNYQIDVLNQVNMYINKGEMVGLVGKSGAGKTTIINLIARLEQPDEGTIFLKGHQYAKKNPYMLHPKDVQIVFQDARSSFDPRKTIGYSIAEPLITQGVSKNEAFDHARILLRKCGLDEKYMHSFPQAMSGGQCQRAAIARSISAKPALICFDECTSALDPLSSIKILSLIVELKEEYGYSCLFVSHNIDLVRYYCDRIYCIQQGTLSLLDDGTIL